MKKERIDVLLVQKGYYPSRQQAQGSILAGIVFVNQERVDKVGTKICIESDIHIKGQIHPYVSRGGMKLEEALRFFQLDIAGKIMVDIGASTGGFTDCALQNGVSHVYAIDVGYGQLAWSLRQDPRVSVMERTNFRYIKREDLGSEVPNFATIDVSFISLAHILPPLYRVLGSGGHVISLVKPQFEAGKEQIGKKGVVRDPDVHKDVLRTYIHRAYEFGYNVNNITISPIQGGEGNIEFLAHITKEQPQIKNWESEITHVVHQAHQRFFQA